MKRALRRGFTLLELLVATVVVAVTASLAPPSYRALIQQAELLQQIYAFDAALNLARSEAVKRGRSVALCPSASPDPAGAQCAGADWEQGWIVFVDRNGNGGFDAGEDLLRASGPLVSGYTLRGSAATLCAGSPCVVTLDAEGVPNAAGVFMLCHDGALDPSRAILLSSIGRISLADVRNGVPLDASGHPMTSCTP